METRWPFGGFFFFLKIADEREGTHLYDDYQKELAEAPVTEDEGKEHRESAQAVLAELERLNIADEQRRKDEEGRRRVQEFYELPFTSDLIIQLGDYPQSKGSMEPEKTAVPDQPVKTMPDESKHYVSDIVGEDFKSWENGRVILDCGTGCGKNEFIIKKLAGWLVDRLLTGEKNDTILYLCPLNSLHAEMIRRRMEAEIADIGQEAADETHLYKDALVIQTCQDIEKLCRNAPDRLKESLSSPKYIVADECHYLTDFSTYNINTYLSLEALQRAERDHVVIYMSATGGQVYEMLNAATETPPDRIYTLPQNNAHIARMYFYARDNLEMILHDIPADEKAVIFMSGGDDRVKMKELFGDAAGYYCSENNARYGKKLDSLEDCIKDRMLQKRFLFTTKAIGMGIEIKDRTLKQSISPYRMPVLVDWIKEHLNQPMKWIDLYTGIMISKVFAEYRNRPMKPTTLNKKLAIYGVQAVRGRDKKESKMEKQMKTEMCYSGSWSSFKHCEIWGKKRHLSTYNNDKCCPRI